jgi:hypothetical protein
MKEQFQNFTGSSKDFINELELCIDNNKPLSLCRIGDGEVAILNKVSNVHIDDMARRWGYDGNTVELIKDARASILNCIKNSDWIGVIGPTPFIKAWHKKGTVKSSWYLDTKFVKESGRIKPIKAVDAFIPRSLELGNIAQFKKLLKGKNIAIISPETEGLIKRDISKKLGCKINYIDVPKNCNIKERSKILNTIKNNIPEHIVLTAWSLLGKDINHILYQEGKICLDMGAVIATWAGRQTRWDFGVDGPHNHCFILD